MAFPAAGHHCSLSSTELYCLVTEAHHISVNNLPSQSLPDLIAPELGLKPKLFYHESNALL